MSLPLLFALTLAAGDCSLPFCLDETKPDSLASLVWLWNANLTPE